MGTALEKLAQPRIRDLFTDNFSNVIIAKSEGQ